MRLSTEEYIGIAKGIRLSVLEIIHKTKSPHIGSSYSIVEILVALYFGAMKIDPANPANPNRDRFILSKGHACATLYAVLAERGFFPHKELEGFAVNDAIFEHHPNKDLLRGIELSTGSLGHGLSVGAGMALAGKIDGCGYRTFVLMSDGETNEGSVWESAMFAGQHKLSNLVAMVDYNKMQALGCTKDIIDLEPFTDKWRAFGWHAQSVDGHDFPAIFGSLDSLSTDKPNVIILNTIKGKGVCYMEERLEWHYRCPGTLESDLARKLINQ